eukprot:gnl/Ergobibamus_cyprinoides/708.p1 GENE.gnl/Ergobibamus_cyprinoides/708~~gnl/Ergobibamus_cyprinoides/708.p1  ORF type:complete len:194 (+),score=40.56 gnl/Ergobibamus_cyprinoides/708:377-958(+)
MDGLPDTAAELDASSPALGALANPLSDLPSVSLAALADAETPAESGSIDSAANVAVLRRLLQQLLEENGPMPLKVVERRVAEAAVARPEWAGAAPAEQTVRAVADKFAFRLGEFVHLAVGSLQVDPLNAYRETAFELFSRNSGGGITVNELVVAVNARQLEGFRASRSGARAALVSIARSVGTTWVLGREEFQ